MHHINFSSQKKDLLILPPLNDLSIGDIANSADSVGVIRVAPFDGFGYDIGLWPGKATNMMIDYWAIRSSEEILKLQNYEGEFDKSEIQLTSGHKNEIRRCTKAIFSQLLLISSHELAYVTLYTTKAGE